MLEVRPIPLETACAFVKLWHRHHRPPQGHKFSIAAELDGTIVGVAIVGRPVSRNLDDGRTLEITRLCIKPDGAAVKNVVSFLLGKITRAAFALGYTHVVSFILNDESGVSLKAAGWQIEGTTPGRSWSVRSRKRVDKHPLGPKVRYGKELTHA